MFRDSGSGVLSRGMRLISSSLPSALWFSEQKAERKRHLNGPTSLVPVQPLSLGHQLLIETFQFVIFHLCRLFNVVLDFDYLKSD